VLEDASVAGLGMLMEGEMSKGDVGTVQMNSVTGDIEAKVEIRHATFLPELDKYRCGLLIQGMDRESAERWVKLVRLVACGTRKVA
jgi:hypothetical protein